MLDMEVLFTDTSAHLVAYFAQRLPPASAHLAEDFAQTVFEKAIRRAERFERRPGVDPKSWLFAIAKHLLIDDWRARKEAPAGLSDALDGVPDRDLERVPLVVDVAEAMTHLTPEQRIVMDLFYWQGCVEPEVVRRSGLTLNAAKKRKSRALRQLRKLLEAA